MSVTRPDTRSLSPGVRTLPLPTGAHAVVVAAGTGAPALCAPLGLDVPLAASAALLARFAATPALVRGVLVAPGIEVREGAGGLLVAALAHAGEGDTGRARAGRRRCA